VNDKKHSWQIIKLILLLLLPIGASTGVGITVTMFVYPVEANPKFTYFMTHPWPCLIFAAAAEAILAIILYRIFSRPVFDQSSKTQPVKYQFREFLSVSPPASARVSWRNSCFGALSCVYFMKSMALFAPSYLPL